MLRHLVLELLVMFNNLSKRLLSNILRDLPRRERVPLREDLLDLLERAADGFWVHEQNVDECGEVESAENEVCLVGDVRETRGDGPCERKVECPVGGGRERDGFAANFERELDECHHREDRNLVEMTYQLSGVCPGHRAHGDSE